MTTFWRTVLMFSIFSSPAAFASTTSGTAAPLKMTFFVERKTNGAFLNVSLKNSSQSAHHYQIDPCWFKITLKGVRAAAYYNVRLPGGPEVGCVASISASTLFKAFETKVFRFRLDVVSPTRSLTRGAYVLTLQGLANQVDAGKMLPLSFKGKIYLH